MQNAKYTRKTKFSILKYAVRFWQIEGDTQKIGHHLHLNNS